MFASVRPLRVAGQRIERERLRAMAPKQGELSVRLQPDHWREKRFSVATLCSLDGRYTYLLPTLCHVQVRRWIGSQLVLMGIEQVDDRRIRKEYPQAWWIQLLSDPGSPASGPPASGE
jgi:hypothetical protein